MQLILLGFLGITVLVFCVVDLWHLKEMLKTMKGMLYFFKKSNKENKMKKIIIFLFIISMIMTSNVYADYYSELIDKLLCIEEQRTQREPIEVELKGSGDTIVIYKTSILKIKKVKPIKPKK